MCPMCVGGYARWGTCLALRFQTGSWMLFIDSRNSNNCLYFPNVTFKTYLKWRADTFSALQIACTPLDSRARASKHHSGASRVFSILVGSWSARL